jgi:pre-mRNA-splicing factor ISY1
LIRVKGHWERRILELGGTNYRSVSRPIDLSGETNRSFDDRSGYRYFGAARSLPGVKELFDKQDCRMLSKTRYHLLKNIDSDYFGFHGEDCKTIKTKEKIAEIVMRKQVIESWNPNRFK